jgi:DNA end-binding protein Ku
MPRPIWKGSVSFGLVNIPVEVHTAVRETRPHFRLLHRKDRSPIKYQRVCEREGDPVDWDDIVKGFEYAKGQFVVLTDEDFERAALEKTKTIDIIDFVRAEEIDDRFFDKPYYLTPAKGGETAYALLRETIRDSERIGIAKFVLRDTQHLAAVEAIGDALVLSMMRFADELVDTSEYRFPPSKGLRTQDVKTARLLVDNLAAEWDPSKYTDDYRVNLMKVIDAKRKGREARLTPEEAPRTAEVVDLMERLRASLEATKGGRRTAAHAKPKRAASRRSAKRTRRAA